MGTKMVPSYANIFMGDLEERLMVVTRKDIFGFRHFVCEFYRRMDTVGMFQKIINLFIAMCPLHVNVVYK
jgi:hypothetical protein